MFDPTRASLRSRLAQKAPLGAFWMSLGSASVVEIAASAKPDAIVIDVQHGLFDRQALEHAVGAASRYAGVLVRTHGRFVYPLDDPAIHLSVARRLAFDGTWGVVAGHYQAASSSPLWTLILTPTQWLVRGSAGEQVPLVLNLAAGLWVIALLSKDMGVLVAGDTGRRPGVRTVELAVVAGVVALALFLPGLVLVGMEHTLHMALVLATAQAVEARWVRPYGRDSRWSRLGPFVLMALATACRGESSFVAVALAVGLLGVGLRGWYDPDRPPAPRWNRIRAGLALGVASAAAIAVFGAINIAFGQALLPNSVILKSLGDRGDTRRSPLAALDRLTSDKLVVALVIVAVVVLVAARRRRPTARAWLPAVFPALVTLVTIALQAELGAMDASLRYQAYIYGLGMWMTLRALPAAHRWVVGRWPRVPAAALLLVLLVPAAVTQGRNTETIPGASEITWEQRYQVARFLAVSYRHAPIAIGELGYISLYHDGPLTDVYGLADYEVLQASLHHDKTPAFWDAMVKRRGFRVVATYDFTMAAHAPADWYAVADWRSPHALYKVTRFWATDPGEVEPLLAALHAYQPRLPSDVQVSYNPLVALAARQALQNAAK